MLLKIIHQIIKDMISDSFTPSVAQNFIKDTIPLKY